MANIDKFDSMASKYDSGNRLEIAKLSEMAIRRFLPTATEGTWLDFGCGTGLIGLEFTDLVEELILLDASQAMLSVVEEKIQARQITNARTQWLNLEDDVELNLAVDCIFMAQVLLHIPDYVALFEKLFKLLKPGGRLIIVDFDENEHVNSPLVHGGFNHDALRADLGEVGYQNIQIENFHQGEKLLMNTDATMFVLVSERGVNKVDIE